MLLFLANLASLAPLAMQVLLAATYGHADNGAVFLGSVAMTMAVKLAKRVALPFLPAHAWLARPCAATDCSALNMGGPVGGNPGFPSGHVTVTAFMVLCLVQRGAVSPATAAAVIASVAWARCAKRCHTLLQVGVGLLVGAAAARLYAWVRRRALARPADSSR
jgi:membrane-associated phospholipid phosphatase